MPADSIDVGLADAVAAQLVEERRLKPRAAWIESWTPRAMDAVQRAKLEAMF